MKRPRHLSPDERALWDKVAARTQPLNKRAMALRIDEAPAELPFRPAKPALDKQAFEIGAKADHSADHDLMSGLSEQLGKAPVRMDARTHGKMKRGKLKPEGRIDLHGMTLAQAHPALTSFIMSSHQARKRLVLVITGKGRNRDDNGPIPVRHGVLRHQVPAWLAQPPLSSAVLQVTEAHRSHGGHGALYVYLRRIR